MVRERIVSLAISLTVGLGIPIYGQGGTSFSFGSSVAPFLVDPFGAPRTLLTLPTDTLSRPPALLSLPYKVVRTVYIDGQWTYITVGESIQGVSMRMPFIAPVDWYVSRMITVTREKQFIKVFKEGGKQEIKQEKPRSSGRGIEVVGMDVDRIGRVSISARGNVTLKGKMVFQDQELIRSKISETQNTHLEFDQTQRISVEGKIGDRVSVKVDQDSERDFDWENNIRISYKGGEDDIIQTVEAGNVSLSLPGSQSLMGSASHKGLFGIKTVSKLGPMNVTAIASVIDTEKKSQEYQGRSEAKNYKIKDSNYIKNKYFFIHEWFRNGVDTTVAGAPIHIPSFYPLKDGLHLIGNVIVRDFELYQLDQSTNSETDPGVAQVDVNNPGKKDQTGLFKRLEQGQDYILSEDLGFIRLRQRASSEVLGCTFVLTDSSYADTLLTIGLGITADNDQLLLQMIKPRDLIPSHPVWPLMFKNVYYLGTTNINRDGFEVRIVNNHLPLPSHLDPVGTPYITRFGLDNLDVDGNRTPDHRIDMSDPNLVNLSYGELFFPEFRPFAADTVTDGNQNPALKGSLGEGLMYTTTLITDISNDSRFTIEVDYSNQTGAINLGFMIVEGSEQVYRGGVLLKKGVDYQMDYFSGTIILNDEVDSNEKIRVVYDKYQLVTFDKKTLLGVRSQMDFGENSFIGGTALYYNQSVINEKIEVGYEPMRNFIWGFNGRIENEISGLTRTLDRLPVVSTETVSKFSMEGEFAQIMPNPNPLNSTATGDPSGVAYIDDFEGSKRTTTISIQRRFWKESSAPLDIQTGTPLSQRYRSRINWYNPLVQVRTKDIWPNLSTSIQAQNETTDILVLRVQTRDHHQGVPRDSIWAGIISPFYSGDYDQTQTKFFEIWVKGDRGSITVDLGEISEDWDGNGLLNTEDIPVGGLIGDGILDDKEDVGLDGCPDEFEDGWGSCLDPIGATYGDLKDQGETILINVYDDVDPEDPNGDNWDYIEFSFDYSRINGTEGNALDAARYPDTEDLDRTGLLDGTNDYFTKTFFLSDTLYFAGETKKDGIPTGWRLFRIPLNEFDQSDNTQIREWNAIHHLRLVVRNVDDSALIQVAKAELVGNDWQELGIAADTSEKFIKDAADSVFAVSVINTDDNADYRPPRGVRGEFDQINQIRSKEQSLVLKFNDFPVRHTGAAMKTLLALSGERAQSYLTYRRMKMFVYGKSPWIQGESTQVEMFLRFGFGNNFYEITQPVYDGWDQDRGRNAVDLDLEWLTRLKLQDSTSVNKFRDTDVFIDSVNFKEYRFTDEDGKTNGKRVRIQGQPSLDRIQFFIAGIRSLADEPINGEIWLDELRLSGVKKDKGVSLRLQGRLNLADLANMSVIYRRQDADFHTLQRRLGSFKSSESINVNTNLRLDKFMPSNWGMSIPVSATYAGSLNQPKYFPGQDVIVNASNVPDSILVQSQTLNFKISASKSSKSDNRLLKYTLDRLNTSFAASRSDKSNEIQKEVLSESYTGAVKYSLPFGRNNYFMPFKWLDGLPLIGEKLGRTHLYYSPTVANASMNFNEKLTQSTPRHGQKSPDNYNFVLNQSYSLNYKLTETIKSKFSRSIKSNLNNYRGYVWGAVQKRDPGVVTDISENMNTSFSPVIADWLKPTFNYSTNYRWNKARNSNVDGANIGNQLRFTGGLSISPVKLVELIYKPAGRKVVKSQRSRSRQRTPVRTDPESRRPEESDIEKPLPGSEEREEKAQEKEEKKLSFRNSSFLKFIHTRVKKINPINFSYSENLNRTGRGVQGEVPLGYRFGWLPEHGLNHSYQVVSNTGNWDHKRDFTVRSGVNFTRQISVSLNYSQSISINRQGSGREDRTLARDYVSYGKHLDSGFPFVGWSLRWTGLERTRFIKKYVRTLSIDHAVSGKELRRWRFEQYVDSPMPLFALSSFIDDYGDQERSVRVNMNFSPLVGFTMVLRNNVSVTLRHNRNISREKKVNGGLDLSQDQSYTSTVNYVHRGGFTIPLPFFDDFKVQNQVNFTFNFDMNKNRKRAKTKESIKFAETAFTSNWKAGLRVTYSFSSKVSGSIIWEYRESDSKHTGKRIDRDFGFDVNLAIQG